MSLDQLTCAPRPTAPAGPLSAPLGERMLREVVLRRPALGQTLNRSGQLSLLDHAASLFPRAPGRVSETALGVVGRWVERLFGAAAAAGTVAQLRVCPSVNTGEHLSPLSHPRRWQSNLLAARGAAEQGFHYVPVFACSAISLANSSYPRGIVWNGRRLPLVTGRVGSRSVFAWPAVAEARFRELPGVAKGAAGVAHLKAAVPELLSAGSEAQRREIWQRAETAVLSGRRDGLARALRAADLPDPLVERALGELGAAIVAGEAEAAEIAALLLAGAPAAIFTETRYTLQVCRLNAHLWARAMREAPGMPRLIYLPMEEITVPLLGASLRRPGDPLAACLLDPTAREAALALFAGLPSTWSDAGGTHFFWGLARKGRLIPLRRQGDELCGEGFTVALTTEALLAALDAGSLVPGTLLQILSLLAHGFRCLGGPNQIQYAPAMVERMDLFRRRFGLEPEAAGPEAAGDFLCGPLFWWRRDPGSGRLLPGSTDAFLRQPGRSLAEAEEAMRGLTLRAATVMGIPDLYRTIVPGAERSSELEGVEQEQVAEEVGRLSGPRSSKP
jgi:hypothetical protein